MGVCICIPSTFTVNFNYFARHDIFYTVHLSSVLLPLVLTQVPSLTPFSSCPLHCCIATFQTAWMVWRNVERMALPKHLKIGWTYQMTMEKNRPPQAKSRWVLITKRKKDKVLSYSNVTLLFSKIWYEIIIITIMDFAWIKCKFLV